MAKRYDVFYYLCPYCEQYQLVADISNDDSVSGDYHCTECEKDYGAWKVKPDSPFGQGADTA